MQSGRLLQAIKHVRSFSTIRNLFADSNISAVPTISCSAVANADIGTTLVIQEWLAYNSLIKLSNWFESIVSQLLPASNNALSLSANLATVNYL